MKQVQVACAGGWQAHARDFSKKLEKYPNCVLTAVYDADALIGNDWAKTSGCRYVEDYDALLVRDDVDAVVITAANVEHAEMIQKAALAGKHVYVEKPAFVTNEEAYATREIVKRSGVKFMVADPLITPPLMLAKQMMDEGKLGRIISMRVKIAHPDALLGTQAEGVYDPAQSGGGALMDMGCHACHMIEWLLGRPEEAIACPASVTEKAKQYGMDDSAVVVFKYADGTLAVGETGWVSQPYENGLAVFGSKGCVVSQDRETRYCLSTGPDGRSGNWIVVKPEEYPPMRTYPLEYWINSIVHDTPVEREDIDEAVLLTEMITAAYRSSAGMRKL